MPRARPEKKPHEARLLRLAAWILEQSEPVTRGQIYAAFPDEYRGKADTAERKFSRDKDALKRLGFNLETEELGGREEQTGYAIDARSSSLPSIDLGADEAAAVWTAGVGALRLSQHPLREELESALRKLVVGTKRPPAASGRHRGARDRGERAVGEARPEARGRLGAAEAHPHLLLAGRERRGGRARGGRLRLGAPPG